MKKLMLVLVTVISSFITGCKDETLSFTADEQNKFVENKLQRLYNLERIEKSAAIDLSSYKTIPSCSQQGPGMILTFHDTSAKVFILCDQEFSNKYHIYKYLQEGAQEINISFEGTIIIEMDARGTGYVDLQKEGANSRIFFDINRLDRRKTSAFANGHQVVYSGFWCQRKKGENTKSCFARESEEFCSDYVSIVAYYTNITIPALIATMCTC